MGSLFCITHPDLSSVSRAAKRSENIHLPSLNSEDCDLIPTDDDDDAPFSVAVISTR